MEKIEVVNVLKTIISFWDGGMPIENIQEEFELWEYKQIPYMKLGYPSLFHFLRDYPEIKIEKNAQGESVFVVKQSKSKTAYTHMNLRSKRKESNYRKTKRPTPYNKKMIKPRTNFKSGYYSEGSSGYLSYDEEKAECPKIIIDPHKTWIEAHEPIINGQQLIGDDFFLQLAIKNIGVTIWRNSEKAALESGLCISGQTIRDCTRRLKNCTSICNKVTIMLGSVDIYQGRTLEEMKKDFLELLWVLENDFSLSKSAITICTIPPLANVSFLTQFDKHSTLLCFNSWLRQVVFNIYDIFESKYSAYNIIDFNREFSNDFGGIDYKLFQEDARYVSGTQHPYVLFNKDGRANAIALFYEGKKLNDYDDFPPSSWAETQTKSYF